MTAQIPERIYIDGKGYSMFTEPLNPFLAGTGLIDKLDSGNTACYRGYYGTWEIIIDQLFLIRFIGYYSPTRKLLWKELFPGQKIVLADWYTGTLQIPWGQMTEYIHHGYGSQYEKYLLVEIKDGKVLNRKIADGSENKDLIKL